LEEVEMKTVTTVMLVLTTLVVFGCITQEKSSGETGQPTTPPGVSLHAAALRGNIDAVRKHIKAGLDLNEKDEYGSAASIVAAIFGTTEVAMASIEAVADTKISDNYR
jgi:ankyrin repeat protein